MNYISNGDFRTFISNIIPNETENKGIISSHEKVRDILTNSDLNAKIRKTLVTGSYKRNTDTKKLSKSNSKVDVDLGVIFKKDALTIPQSILDKLYNVLNNEDEYKGKLIRQKRSIGIELSNRHVDVVPFQEVEINQDKPLSISSLNKQEWEITNPICHIDHFIKVKQKHLFFTDYVRAIKWWIKINKPNQIKYPIGIAVETLVEKYYSDNSNQVSALLEIMKVINSEQLMILLDPCNNENNLLSSKKSQKDLKDFYTRLNKSLEELHQALINKNINVFRKYFGNEFPKCEIISFIK
jgi:hypothetical protein